MKQSNITLIAILALATNNFYAAETGSCEHIKHCPEKGVAGYIRISQQKKINVSTGTSEINIFSRTSGSPRVNALLQKSRSPRTPKKTVTWFDQNLLKPVLRDQETKKEEVELLEKSVEPRKPEKKRSRLVRLFADCCTLPAPDRLDCYL